MANVFVAGHRGLVGSAIVRRLKKEPNVSIITRTRDELDLTNQAGVKEFFEQNDIDQVYLAAARVGGILANDTYPAEFIHDNLAIQTNVIHYAWKTGVKKLLFLGSSCIYPRDCPQPIKEEYLLTGPLEPTNDAYAIAKIAGIKMCQAYRKQYGFDAISLMPTNLYGPGDNFDLETSHVLPALIRKFQEGVNRGTPVVLWGTGLPRREFLHSDDLADGAKFIMDHYSRAEPINVGSGNDITIRELAGLVQQVSGFQGEVHWDHDKPDGTPRKMLDVSVLKDMGWRPQISLRDGIAETYRRYAKGAANQQPANVSPHTQQMQGTPESSPP